MKRLVLRFRKFSRDMLGAVTTIRKTTSRRNTSFFSALGTALRLYAVEQFSLKEIVGYALYLPEISREMPVMISKQKSLAKLARINPRDIEERVEDKSLFYKACEAAGLPVPKHFGVFCLGEGFDAHGEPIHTRAEWIAYFETRLPTHFVVKDIAGVYGSGFSAFERFADGFKQINGPVLSVDGLYDWLAENSHAGLVIQERLFNHPGMSLCASKSGLCTLRVNTLLVDEKTGPSLLFYIMKIPVGGNITDNFSMGASGNLIAFGDHDTGVLRGARVLHASGAGLATIRNHPDNGHDIDGYAIPMWHQAVELAKHAHGFFREFGTLGWDLALTERGPVILEANPWWDPPMYAPQVMTRENWQRIFG